MTDTFKGIITADGKKRQLPYGSILETPVSDETLSIQGAFADSKVVGDKFKEVKTETDSLNEDLDELGNKILCEEYADLLHGKEPKENWYIDASNGNGKTLAQFFSFTDIDVSNYIGQRIYPYTSIDKVSVSHSSRSIVFYNEDGSYIVGHGVSSGNPINGIEVPNGAKNGISMF